MGRTVPTFNMSLDREIGAWKQYRRALRAEDQPVFDQLFAHARQHMAEAAAAARPVPFDAVILSILLEQQKQIIALREKLGTVPPQSLPPSPPAPENLPRE